MASWSRLSLHPRPTQTTSLSVQTASAFCKARGEPLHLQPLTSHLLDVTSGTEIASLGGHRSDTRSGAFSHDGRLVATVSIDGTARLWDGVTGKFISSLGAESSGLRTTDANVAVARSGYQLQHLVLMIGFLQPLRWTAAFISGTLKRAHSSP